MGLSVYLGRIAGPGARSWLVHVFTTWGVCDGDGDTDAMDLAVLLGNWGPVDAGHCLDANGDGLIGAFDLAILLGAWGPVTPDSACLDADENGLVEAFDLAVLLGAWGPCP